MLLNAANNFLTCKNAVTIEPRNRVCRMTETDNELTNFADACRGHRTITVTFWMWGELKLSLTLKIGILNFWG